MDDVADLAQLDERKALWDQAITILHEIGPLATAQAVRDTPEIILRST
ncbi:hypothetical protein [Kibdelosporangium aridum]